MKHLARNDQAAVTPATTHRRPIYSGYAAYEAHKRDWDLQHPEATPTERDVAMMRIAQECGV